MNEHTHCGYTLDQVFCMNKSFTHLKFYARTMPFAVGKCWSDVLSPLLPHCTEPSLFGKVLQVLFENSQEYKLCQRGTAESELNI